MSEILMRDLSLVMPEMVIASTAILLQMLGVFCSRAQKAVGYLAVLVCGLLAFYMTKEINLFLGEGFYDMYISNAFNFYSKIAILIAMMFSILVYIGYHNSLLSSIKSEYITLILMSVVGMFLMISSQDFVLLYVGLELQSLSLYILASFNVDNVKSTEAGVKYFILGALASGITLFGMSFIYGFAGTLNFEVLHTLYGDQSTVTLSTPPAVVFGIVMVLAGICFKLSAAPFHLWTPDVYEGAPITSVSFFASVPKMAAMAVMLQILFKAFDLMSDVWLDIVKLVAVLSLVIGSFGAIWQQSLKRLMAYSTIVNIGYIFIAFAAKNIPGIQASLIYLLIYTLTTIGLFALLIAALGKNVDEATLSDLAGLSESRKALALMISIIMFSMIGIPPLAGFLGKFYIFKAALLNGNYYLAVLGILASVVSAYYYLRIIKLMYFDTGAKEHSNVNVSLDLYIVIYAILLFTLFLMLFPNELLQITNIMARLF